ncbi:hypothetical protein BG015_010083 [Linnemannia schmuckeri]|uniref:GRF-type domain-containing protein n=1 Tax=Linnemannia schmuckeri TaxID=64567 RepID=A0A9P5V9B3_9FUNG|nr:hypothetical protein BG015_010083 [Linnemannia schmuckeri]
MATLFSIFESTPGDVLREALKTSNGDLEQAIPWILSHNSSSTDTNTNFTMTSKSTPFSSSLTTPARKKQKLIQPRLSDFMPTPSSLSIFKPGISPPSSHQHSNSSNGTNVNSFDASLSSNNTPASSLPSLNDRLRWKEPPLTDSTTSSTSNLSDSAIPSSSTQPTKLKPPKPLILYNPEDVAKHCPCTLIFNVLDKDLANRLLKAMLIDSETWNRNRWWLFERMVESPHKTSYFAERDDDMEEVAGWTYNGKQQDPPRRFLPEMEEAKMVVRRIVNQLRKERDIGTARINITFRLRREGFSPQDTPVCKCGVAMVLRCVFKNKANYGRYFYMCYASGSKMGQTCGQFSWVDMEQKLGLLSSLPGAAAAVTSGASNDTVSIAVQQQQQQDENPPIGPVFGIATESEGKTKHPRSPSQELGREHDDPQESGLNLVEELQEDDTAFLEQQWEAIGEADDLTLE